jgi:hypothetical protein
VVVHAARFAFYGAATRQVNRIPHVRISIRAAKCRCASTHGDNLSVLRNLFRVTWDVTHRMLPIQVP